MIQTDSKFSDRVTENFVDTAMKVYHRLFTAAPESLDIIMEDCWPPCSAMGAVEVPFSAMGAVEIFCLPL